MYKTKNESNLNYGLHVITLVNIGSSLVKKCTILMSDVHKEGDYACAGAEGI